MSDYIYQNGHSIVSVGEGGLAYCETCCGGEVELDEPCNVRVQRERESYKQRIAKLESSILQAVIADNACRDLEAIPNTIDEATAHAKQGVNTAGIKRATDDV